MTINLALKITKQMATPFTPKTLLVARNTPIRKARLGDAQTVLENIINPNPKALKFIRILNKSLAEKPEAKSVLIKDLFSQARKENPLLPQHLTKMRENIQKLGLSWRLTLDEVIGKITSGKIV